jgi:thioredoxin-related protein
MKKKIYFLIYGFTLITIWSCCFLGAGMADANTAVMGLVFTPLSVYFLQKEYDFKLSLSDKWAIMILPVLYLCSFYYILYDQNYFKMRSYNFVAFYQVLFYLHIINPITIAFIVLVLGLTKLKDLTNPRNIFIFASIAIFYAYFFMFTWKNSWTGGRQVSFDTETLKKAGIQNQADSTLYSDVNLAEFSFINPSLDTVTLLDDSGKYILLETWAETCPPCIKAINELPGFYRSVEDKLRVYYVYEHRKASVRRNFEKIFSFGEIKDKSKMLVDIDQELYFALNMQGYPYFLLFDAKGKLVHTIRGYGDKDRFIAQITPYILSGQGGGPQQ